MKPTFVKNQISAETVVHKGKLQVKSDRFTTRVRTSGEVSRHSLSQLPWLIPVSVPDRPHQAREWSNWRPYNGT